MSAKAFRFEAVPLNATTEAGPANVCIQGVFVTFMLHGVCQIHTAKGMS